MADLPTTMFTRQGLKCDICQSEIWIRVDAMSVGSVLLAACNLADLMVLHLVRDHDVALPATPPEDTITVEEFRKGIGQLFSRALGDNAVARALQASAKGGERK